MLRRPANKLRTILVHPKDKVKELVKGQGVYKVPGLSCPAVYIGETSRRLSTRIDEHKKERDKVKQQQFTRSQNYKLSNNKSAITDHADREDHVIDWEGTRLVARENNIVQEGSARPSGSNAYPTTWIPAVSHLWRSDRQNDNFWWLEN